MEFSGVVCGEIRFDEVVPGATVRCMTTTNGTQYLSIRDLIMHACDKNQRDSANIWATLPVKDESCVLEWRFHGRGQVEQPLITFPGAAELLLLLPGENVKRTRSTVTKILARHFNGDAESWPKAPSSLDHEIDCVKASVEGFILAAEEREARIEARLAEVSAKLADTEAKLLQTEAKLADAEAKLLQTAYTEAKVSQVLAGLKQELEDRTAKRRRADA